LFKLLPYLAMVVFQDGVHWIHEFPSHPASILLRSLLPTWYEGFASGSRKHIDSLIVNRPIDKVRQLNEAAQAALTVCRHDVQLLTSQHQRLAHFSNYKVDMLAEQQRQAVIAIQNLDRKIEKLSCSITNMIQNTANKGTEIVEASTLDINKKAKVSLGSTISPNMGEDSRMNAFNQQPQQQAQQQSRMPFMYPAPPTVNSVLRPSSLIPPINCKLPSSFTELLVEHIQCKLSTFQHSRTKQDWGNAKRIAFSKRTYLYNKILLKATGFRSSDTLEEKLRRAAEVLDSVRKNTSLSAFLRTLKQQDIDQRLIAKRSTKTK
jgi:hypothetical protein